MPELKRDVGKDVLKLVDQIHEEKKISREVVFAAIESAIQLAAQRHFEVEEGVVVQIDRATGDITANHNGEAIDPVTLGRIAAQSAKQMIYQKVREAESDTVFNEFSGKKGELIVGTITRIDAGSAIVSLGKSEALLPRSEQIPGETHHVGERVQATVLDVRRTGQRVKIVLSRCHPDFVRSLFEEEIPEIADRTIDIKAVAREAGYRSKLAVASIDLKVDCVGACVGVRGSRIKNIIEELNGERIDIVRWNDSLQVLIPNALSPAQISEVFTYHRLGRAVVLVTDDQLSLAIGRRGQNVRLASKLVGWDIEIMTHDELAEGIDRAERWFAQLPSITEEVIQAMIGEGFLSYNDLTFIDGQELTAFAPIAEEPADEIIAYAEEYAEVMDRSVEEERRQAADAAKAEARAATEAAIAAQAVAATSATAEEPTTADGEPVAVDGEPAAEPEPEGEVNLAAVGVSAEEETVEPGSPDGEPAGQAEPRA